MTTIESLADLFSGDAALRREVRLTEEEAAFIRANWPSASLDPLDESWYALSTSMIKEVLV